MNFKFGKTSEEKLSTVNSQLASVARKALELTPIDFGITEGRRSIENHEKQTSYWTCYRYSVLCR